MATTKRDAKLSQETLNLCAELIKAHGDFTQVRKNMQLIFLKTFRNAMSDVGGPHWYDDQDEANVANYFLQTKRLVWHELREHFDLGTFRTYFTIVKKMLWYEIDDWKFCKDFSEPLLERALKEVHAASNEDDTYFDQNLIYQDAVKFAAKKIKDQDEEEKENGALEDANDIGHFKVPKLAGKTQAEWRNEWLLFIRRVSTHPKVASMLQGDDPQAKACRVIYNTACKNLVEKKKTTATAVVAEPALV